MNGKKKRISIALSQDLVEELKNIQKEIEKRNNNDVVKVSFSAIVEKILREGLKLEKVKKELGI